MVTIPVNGDAWEYEPETQRFIVNRPGEPMPCEIRILEDAHGEVVTREGRVVGWCATHDECEWIPYEMFADDEE